MPAPTRIPRHYAFVTRTLLQLFAEGRFPAVRRIDVEPEYGGDAQRARVAAVYAELLGSPPVSPGPSGRAASSGITLSS